MPFHKSSIVNRQPTIVKKNGFTLIELLVAVAIIGILVAGITFAFNNARDKARDNKKKQDLSAIKGALELYFEDNAAYAYNKSNPSKTTYISSESQPWIPGPVPNYIKELPLDSRQSISGVSGTYAYVVASNKLSYVLWAQLENTSDAEIYNKSSASCRKTPPSGGYNFCIASGF